MPSSAEPKESPSPATRRSKRRRVLFPLIAIVLALVPFVLLEIVLRTVDVGDPTGYVDPFVGFGRAHPLFTLTRDQENYETTRSHQLYFGTQRFSAKKPANMVRVFCLGGSTVRGRPYTTETSFAKWLQIELKLRDPSRDYEVINCGGLSYASYRLARITEEVMEYEPDLIVVATGHNEFLEDRTYQDVKSRSNRGGGAMAWLYSLRTVTLARRLGSGTDVEEARESEQSVESEKTVMEDEVKARLDDQSGYASYHRDAEWQKQVVNHFGHSLRGMIKMCNEHKVPLVLVGLGSNLRDCPPFKSELATTLKDAERNAFQRAYEAGEREEDNPEVALEYYRKAEAIDAGHALLNYRMARCFDRLDEAEQAADYYIRAKDTDVLPLRMVEETYQLLLKVCRETKVPLVDVRVTLRKLAPQGIPGYDQYMDHVHPTIRTHQFIAEQVADRLEQQEFVASKGEVSDQDRRQAYRKHFAEFKDTYLVNGRRRVSWLEKWARRSLSERETTPFDARGYLELGKRKLLFGEPGYAWTEFDKAIALDAVHAEVLLGYAQEFFHGGQYFLSRNLLDELQKHELAQGYAANIDLALLIVALELGNHDEVVEIYKQRTDALHELAEAKPLWLEAMPDALEQAKKLAAKSD